METIEVNKEFEIRDDFSSPELEKHWTTQRILPGDFSIKDGALKITLNPGDMVEAESERAEISLSEESISPGTEVWYRFSIFIPEDFQINNNRLVIAQWKQPSDEDQSSDSPFLSYRYQDGMIIAQVIVNESDDGSEDKSVKRKFKSPELERGIWHEIKTNYSLDDQNNGRCKFIIDGQIIGEYEGKMGYKHLPKTKRYFKMGLYRDRQDYSQTISFSKFRRGPQEDSTP